MAQKIINIKPLIFKDETVVGLLEQLTLACEWQDKYVSGCIYTVLESKGQHYEARILIADTEPTIIGEIDPERRKEFEEDQIQAQKKQKKGTLDGQGTFPKPDFQAYGDQPVDPEG